MSHMPAKNGNRKWGLVILMAIAAIAAAVGFTFLYPQG
jgi:LPS O-antigen subunit length determinant protein (WzzB/FepE family)